MITFFSEADLVSFGTYMVSELRETHIRNNTPPTENIEEILSTVTDLDLAHWAHLITSKQDKNNEG